MVRKITFLIPFIVAIGVGIYLMVSIKEPEPLTMIDPLDAYLDGLVDMECKNYPDCFKGGDHRILDTNNFYSYSCLMFQKATFIEKVKKYGLAPYAEAEDYDNLIMNCEFQKLVARKMFENEKGAYLHWKVSVINRGYGRPQLTLNK